MLNRIYPLTVVVFWLSTMCWLVTAKVLPGLRRGDPPNHHIVSAKQMRNAPPIVWDLKWNDHLIGWAATKVRYNAGNQTQILTRIQFTRRPEEMVESRSWLMQQLADWASSGAADRLQIENRTDLDSRGHLASIHSAVKFGDGEASETWMRIEGLVKDRHLNLEFHLGDGLDGENQPLASRSIPIRPDALVSNEISPRGFMPPLRLNQQWTTRQVSPMRPPTGRQPPIMAKVERIEGLIWDNRAIETFLVVYRKDEGSGSRAVDEYLGRMWVRPRDGMVLKQEVKLLGSRLAFIRRSAEKARPLAELLDRQWTATPDDSVAEPGRPIARPSTKSGAPAATTPL